MGTGGTISRHRALPEGEEPEGPGHRRRPGGLDPQALQGDRQDRRGAHLQDRGRGRGLHPRRATDFARDRPRRSRATTATGSTWRGGWRARRRSSSAARPAWRRGWRSRWRGRCGPNDLVVVLLPDTGERYLTQGAQRRVDARQPPARPDATRASRDVVGRQGAPRAARCCRSQAGEPLRSALALIEQHDVIADPGAATATRWWARSTRARSLKARARRLRARSTSPVRRADGRSRCRWWRADEPVDAVDAAARGAQPGGAGARQRRRSSGILTRFDMLQFIAGGDVMGGDRSLGPEVRLQHARDPRRARSPIRTTGAVMVPIYQTSTYAQEALGQAQGLRVRAHATTPRASALEREPRGARGRTSRALLRLGARRHHHAHADAVGRRPRGRRRTTSTAAPTGCSTQVFRRLRARVHVRRRVDDLAAVEAAFRPTTKLRVRRDADQPDDAAHRHRRGQRSSRDARGMPASWWTTRS